MSFPHICTAPALGEDEVRDVMGAGGTGVWLLLFANNVRQQIITSLQSAAGTWCSVSTTRAQGWLHLLLPNFTHISLVAIPILEADWEGKFGKLNSSLAKLTPYKTAISAKPQQWPDTMMLCLTYISFSSKPYSSFVR